MCARAGASVSLGVRKTVSGLVMKTKWGSGFKIQPALNPQAVCPASAAQRGRLFLIFTQDLSGLAAEVECRP